MHKYLTFLCQFLISIATINTQNFYKVAVVEYAPKRDSSAIPSAVILENIQTYKSLIADAFGQGASIIVFPEAGLTTLEFVKKKVKDHLHSFAIVVPDPNRSKSDVPCNNQNNYDTKIVEFSCAAVNHKMYIVVNVVEIQHSVGDTASLNISIASYYNTNIVFDPLGRLITRYRKNHLDGEMNFLQGDTSSTFTTDFGVDFNILIGADILYADPTNANTVQNVIYSSAQHSILPFFTTISFQDGLSKAFQINLVAAGLNNPNNGNSGSGIYSGNGTYVAYISGRNETKLIIADLPKVPQRHNSIRSSRQQLQLDVTKLNYLNEDLGNYTIKSLSRDSANRIACSKDFCCEFNVTYNSAPQLVYKMLAFSGVRSIYEKKIGVLICAIVFCLNDTDSTCGKVSPTRTESGLLRASVTGNFITNKTLPITLTHNLIPANNYEYSADLISIDGINESLLVFGLLERVSQWDDQELGERSMPVDDNIADKRNNIGVIIGIILGIIGAILLLMLVWKYRVKIKMRLPKALTGEERPLR